MTRLLLDRIDNDTRGIERLDSRITELMAPFRGIHRTVGKYPRD